jgi:hypothetical protein
MMIRATVISLASLLGFVPPAISSPGNRGAMCVAKVVKSEKLASAPMGYWLVSVTFEIASPDGPVFAVTLQDTMPW